MGGGKEYVAKAKGSAEEVKIPRSAKRKARKALQNERWAAVDRFTKPDDVQQ